MGGAGTPGRGVEGEGVEGKGKERGGEGNYKKKGERKGTASLLHLLLIFQGAATTLQSENVFYIGKHHPGRIREYILGYVNDFCRYHITPRGMCVQSTV